MAKELQESLCMTKFKFLANMKKFLANLLTDPINSEPELIFTHNGLNKTDLIKHLLDNNIILRKNTIDDHDADGKPHTAKMVIKYTVPKNRLNDKLDCLYDILFPSIINEDGCAGAMGGGMGGAASANISAGGQYSQPIFGVQRRSPKKNKTDESKIYEAVTGEDVEKSAATYVYCNDKKGNLHILCAKRIKFPDDEMGGKWNPPMGHLHKGESMIDGAIRECFEESGVKLEKKYLKLISKEDYGNVYKVMLPGTIEDYPPKKGDEENGKFKWLPIEEIGNLEWAWTCGKIAKKLAKGEKLNESVKRSLLTEAKWGKNRQIARRYVENLMKNDKQLYDTVKRMLYNHVGVDNIIEQSNGEVFVLTNNDEIPLESWFFFQLITEMNLGHNKNGVINDCKYDLGLCKLYMNELLVNHNQQINSQITPIIGFLRATPHFLEAVQENNPEFDYNNVTLQQLQELTAEPMKKMRSSNKEKYQGLGINNVRQDYDIYRLENTEHAQNFQLKDGRTIDLRKYTSWCITSSQDNYDAYAGQFGVFYVCLQDGFEQVPEEVGDNCPLDEYGLSMIAICVTPEGDLKNVTCRWNHANRGNDTIMTDEQLAELFNAVPYALFPPRSQEELREMGYITFEEVVSHVQQGDFNIFNYVQETSFGLKICSLKKQNQKYLIKPNGEIIGNTGFNKILLCGNCFKVQNNNLTSFLIRVGDDYKFITNAQGEKLWFDQIYGDGDLFRVNKNNKENYIVPDCKGGYKLVYGNINNTDEWFDYIHKEITCDWFCVGKNNNGNQRLYNYIVPDCKGGYKLVYGNINNTDEWFDIIVKRKYCDCFMVGKNNDENQRLYNYMDINGNLLLDKWISRDEIRQINPDKYYQQQQQQVSLNEIINRLVRNYRRY